jgi:hypothetical protein
LCLLLLLLLLLLWLAPHLHIHPRRVALLLLAARQLWSLLPLLLRVVLHGWRSSALTWPMQQSDCMWAGHDDH